jgi:hypothetical protein
MAALMGVGVLQEGVGALKIVRSSVGVGEC